MTARNQSLYNQLDELQPQLDKILIECLQEEAAGKSSMFISRLMSTFYDGRFYQRPEVKRAEDIANKVIRLKEKLGEPLHEGATGVISRYAELKEKNRYLYSAERANFAKEQLSKFGVKQAEIVQPGAKSTRRLKPHDKISQPSKGRFFPVSTSEVISLVKELNFKHSEYSQRIAIVLINPDAEGDIGVNIAAFYPSDELIVFSFPETFPLARARKLAIAAVHEFSIIDRDITFVWSRQKSISYRAYYSEMNALVITRRERSAKLAKYRGADKYSSRCSPKGIKTDEAVLKQIEVK